MRSVYHRVRATVYFLTPEEGVRSHNVNLRNADHPYELLADFGLGHTENGPRYAAWPESRSKEALGILSLALSKPYRSSCSALRE